MAKRQPDKIDAKIDAKAEHAPDHQAEQVVPRDMTDAECEALLHLGPLCLDADVHAAVDAYRKRRVVEAPEGIVRTIPGPLVTNPDLHAAADAAKAKASA